MANKNISDDPFLLETMFDIFRLSKSTTGDMSLVDIAKHTRVEPISVVNRELVKIKEYNNILNGILNIYLGYYLQAIQLLNISYSNAKVLKTLDSVSPDRSFIVESYNVNNLNKTISLEDSLFSLPGMRGDDNERDIKQTSLDSKVQHLDKMSAVGKVVEVKFTIEDSNDKRNMQEVTIPVNIRLLTMLVEPTVITSILSSNKDEITFSSRLKDAIAGRISFFKDFLLTQDLIKNQKKIIFKDGADAYNDILKRYNNSALFTILNRGNVGYGKISSIYIMTEEDENQIKKQFGTGLNSQKVRNMVFDNSMALIIAVVDREWERVTIYVRDTTGYSQNTFSEFKSMSDKDIAPQLGDILKSFSLGNAAVI